MQPRFWDEQAEILPGEVSNRLKQIVRRTERRRQPIRPPLWRRRMRPLREVDSRREVDSEGRLMRQP